MNKKLYNICLCATLASVSATAGVVAHFPMEVKSGKIAEAISGKQFDVKGNFGAESVAGAVGNGLMFDGYSTLVDASLDNLFAGGSQSMTASVWMAVPCYPIVEIDVNTKEKATIVSCIDETAKKGFGFYLGIDGKVEFKLYTGGCPITVESTKAVPAYQWNNLTAVLDGPTHTLKLYCNGEEIGSTRCNGGAEAFSGTLRFGHGTSDRKAGMFNLMAFNGIIDELKIWNEALTPAQISAMKAENDCDLSIPESRFAEQKLRPRFHGMPGSNWTNESHGMVKSDGRYHVFFQKNANGPYMARLHWGHISSENLYDWREEPIAFAPEASYDFKGCWSGCVFSDEELTGGKPSAIYTAVDYAKATIAQANPTDESLIEWKKNPSNPLINGRPAGLSDDFRDPYFFRNGDKAYIIVGSSSKDKKGVATLHRYENGRWTNDGKTFFEATNASTAGRFWEMPNVTKMADGKWLFTTTPLDMMGGVKTIYWTGDINADGTFSPDAQSTYPRGVELISKEGYGLLSPTIYQENGKTIALGIVPDKLPGSTNYQLGWAHCYSLPREWSIDSEGNLSQKPYEGLKGMRATDGYVKDNFTLNGTENLSPVEGRQAELLMVAEADSSEFGFKFFKGAKGEGKISINAATSRLTVDVSGLERHHNDDGVYSGVYTCSLPKLLKKGEDVTLNVFIDGSILDIFINNRWATSIRVFPTAEDADGIEAFATAPTAVKSLNAWTLKGGASGITDIFAPGNSASANSNHVYTADGMLVRTNADANDPLADLPKGIYIFGGKRMIK